MKKLFEFRTAIRAGKFPKVVKCSWPLGKITFYKEHLEVNSILEKYSLKYSDIDYIKTNFIQVKIEHHNQNIIENIWFDMLFLGNRIKKKTEKFQLPIVFK